MSTKHKHKELLEQLNFMQRLFPSKVLLNFKRTGSFHLVVFFQMERLGSSEMYCYACEYTATTGVYDVTLSTSKKSVYRVSSKSFQEIFTQIQHILKPVNKSNHQLTTMAYEAYWLIRTYISVRDNIGFNYSGNFVKSKTHKIQNKHDSSGMLYNYSFSQNSFPLRVETQNHTRIFNDEVMLMEYIIAN